VVPGQVTVLIMFVVMVVIVVILFLIRPRAHDRVLVPGGPGVHVDVESSRRHRMTDGVLYPHGKGMGILQSRLWIARDVHHGGYQFKHAGRAFHAH
jgi:hypothetical protein